jgi:hypothetical protein
MRLRRCWLRPMLLALPVVLLGCAPGAPPPGPIDIVREIFDPNYDYTDSPDTWRDVDARPRHPRESWSASCPDGDMSCTHEGVTVCCAPRERCCAGRTGPYCCDPDGAGYAGYGDPDYRDDDRWSDEGRWRDD